MKKFQKNNAITLIALAVTIVVLIIISGITISAMTGQNGIIKNSEEAKKNTSISEEKEILNTSAGIAIGKSNKAKVEETYLKNYLNQNIGEQDKDYTITIVEASEDSPKHFDIKFVSTGNEYVISEDGKVLSKEEYESNLDLKSEETMIIDLDIEDEITKYVEISTDSKLAVKWDSSDDTVAKVEIIKKYDESAGEQKTYAAITGVKNGQSTVTIKIANEKARKIEVTVQTSPRSVILDKKEVTLDLSGVKTTQFNTTLTPTTVNVNQELTWTSDDPRIASVDSNGFVTANSPGDAIITVTTKNNRTDQAKIHVIKTITSISINPTSGIVLPKNTMNIVATIEPVDSTEDVIWEVSDTRLATISSSGANKKTCTITGVDIGNVVIKARNPAGTIIKTSEILVGVTISNTSASYSLPGGGTSRVCVKEDDICSDVCVDYEPPHKGGETCEDIWDYIEGVGAVITGKYCSDLWYGGYCKETKEECSWGCVEYADKWSDGERTIQFDLNSHINLQNLKVIFEGSEGSRISDLRESSGNKYSFTLYNSTSSKASGTVILRYVNGNSTFDLYTWTIK